MFDYPVDKRGVVEIVWIYVVAVDLVIEMKSLRIDRAAVTPLDRAYAMLSVTPLDCAYVMLIIKIIDDPPPETEVPASESGMLTCGSGVPAHATVLVTISISIISILSNLLNDFCIIRPEAAKIQKVILI